MSKIVLTAASRVGNVRSNNEDMILAYDRFIRSDIYQTVLAPENLDRFIVAVADGMGGHNAGEVASELVLQNLKFYFNDLPKGLTSGELEEVMNEWLQSIHQTVNARGRANKSMSEMGTTLVGGDDANDQIIVITEANYETVQTAEFTNNKEAKGGLEVTKNVTVNGEATTGNLADGTYTFHVLKIEGEGEEATETEVTGSPITVTISGGAANTATLEGLLPGTYKVHEDVGTT